MRRRIGLAGLIVAGVALAACQNDPGQNIREAVDQTLRQGGMQAAAIGGWREAAASYRSLYDRNPEDKGAALGLIRSLRNMGQPDEAVRIGAAATARHPDDAALLGEYGKARLAANDIPGALETLAAAAARAPGDWTLRSAIGIAHDLGDRHEKAAEAYLAALEVSPNNPSVTNNLALSLALAGDIDAGIARLEGMAPPMRGSLQARQSLALLYALKGDTAKAEPLIRGDLPEKLAAENLAYLRRLDEPAPRVAAPGELRPRRADVAAAPFEEEMIAAPVVRPARAALPRPRVAKATAETAPDTLADWSADRGAQPMLAASAPLPAAPRLDPAPAAGPRASAKPTTLAATALPAASPAAEIRLQLGALRSEAAAREEWERLRQRHPELLGDTAAEITRAELGKRGTFWRIQTAPIADAARAERLCGDLRRQSAACILVRAEPKPAATEREAEIDRGRRVAAL